VLAPRTQPLEPPVESINYPCTNWPLHLLSYLSWRQLHGSVNDCWCWLASKSSWCACAHSAVLHHSKRAGREILPSLYLLPSKRDENITGRLKKSRTFENIRINTNKFYNSFIPYSIKKLSAAVAKFQWQCNGQQYILWCCYNNLFISVRIFSCIHIYVCIIACLNFIIV